MRIAFGIFLMLHGFAHLVGFATTWRLTNNPEMPYKTTLLAGHWEVGDIGIRVNGLLWLVGALAFLWTGFSTIRQTQGWETLALSVSFGSLVLCVFSLPEARIGLLLNLIILACLFAGNWLGWLPGI